MSALTLSENSALSFPARWLFAPYELPVGIILSVLGVPFFLYLIREREAER